MSPLPLVTIKYAQTLDGRIATCSGNSRWVSGPESRVLAHRLRSEHDAVLVGIGTVLADDPRLDVRLWAGPQPLRIAVDGRLRIPDQAAMFGSDGNQAIVATSTSADPSREAALERRGARILKIERTDEGLDLQELLRRLREIGIETVLVEGGAGIITSLLRARLANALVVFVAPKLLGLGLEAIGDLSVSTIDQAIQLSAVTVEASGSDIVVRGKPVWPSA
jgi:riboflavin-specific deaminase-like protein